MEKRKLGNSGLEIAPLVFGGNVFGWTIDETTSFEILDAFTRAGFNCIDTADVYSNWKPGNTGGESETIIGNWLKQRGNREQVIIATKVGGDMGQGKNLKKEYIVKAAEDSLKRLQTDYIDLYQSHYDDPATPLDETLEAYQTLINAGKVRAIGASNYSAERLAEALKTSDEMNLPRYQTLQPEYNLYAREGFEKALEPLCVNNNIGVIPYYSLASGFLTGKYRSEADLGKSQRGGGIQKYLNDRGFRILNALDEVAAELNATPAQVALSWLMHRPGITAPIASATSLNQLNELLKAAELKPGKDAIEKLNRASAY
ncbi:aldo/keto reductase [Adhaeribacter sp. BT258]|uniref:Aldo/keto reductase n=1 Tax=Adhaeribacter terrigena TaxID=2793070 RepID=A0ABS1C1H2_9BACT|nr:aldo/keto reductase [Adhaeribacter terrigena]MBK0402468.1 aldo/keto reductase [Adhaeribacter terrigena]